MSSYNTEVKRIIGEFKQYLDRVIHAPLVFKGGMKAVPEHDAMFLDALVDWGFIKRNLNDDDVLFYADECTFAKKLAFEQLFVGTFESDLKKLEERDKPNDLKDTSRANIGSCPNCHVNLVPKEFLTFSGTFIKMGCPYCGYSDYKAIKAPDNYKEGARCLSPISKG